jgi:hypothetical protein
MMRVLVVGDPSSSMSYVAKKLSALHVKAGQFAISLLTHPPSASADPSDLPAFPIPTFYASQHAPSTPAPSLTNVGPAAALAHSSLNILLIAADNDDPSSPAASTSSSPPRRLAECLLRCLRMCRVQAVCWRVLRLRRVRGITSAGAPNLLSSLRSLYLVLLRQHDCLGLHRLARRRKACQRRSVGFMRRTCSPLRR